ncbi:MAG: DUF2332 family protein [Rhodocyclaceae bacterium]
MFDELRANLDKEYKHCETASVLYAGVFRALIEILYDGAAPRTDAGVAPLIEALRRQWDGKISNAWFERPLMLAAALHVLVRRHGQLAAARFYATCGGAYEAARYAQLRQAIDDILRTHRDEYLSVLARVRVQTNETSRGITLLAALAALGAHKGGNIALFEIGCSAGLNLLADQYGWHVARPAGQVEVPGTPTISVSVSGDETAVAALDEAAIDAIRDGINLRMGCDLNVIDVADPAQAEMLQALIWGDDVARLQRLDAAMATLRRLRGEVSLIEADAAVAIGEAAPTLVRLLVPGQTVVFFNTIVTSYFSDADYARLRQAVGQAFAGPLAAYRCAWIEHEPARSAPAERSAHQSLVTVNTLHANGALVEQRLAGVEFHPRHLVFL